MEPLDKKENEILRLLAADSIALENFLVEFANPRFLPFLNGGNSKKLNIFQNGFAPQTTQWKEHSIFLLPAMYLEKIADRLSKETTVNPSIRQEYTFQIQQALKSMVAGYIREHKKDPDVVQMLLRIIQTQDISFLDAELFGFIIENLKEEKSSIVVRNISSIIKKMLSNGQGIERIEQCIELMLELLPNDVSSDNRSYFIENFLMEQEIIDKLTDICSDAFLTKLANNLTQTLDQQKDIMLRDGLNLQIQEDCSLQVSLSDKTIQFVLPYVEFEDKDEAIKPIIEEKLKDYASDDKKLWERKILYWYTYIWSDLTYISYASLNTMPKGYYRCRQKVLVYLLKEILLARFRKQGFQNFSNTYQTITLQNKYFIFKRILLYCLGQEFDKTRDMLFSLIDKEKYLLFSLYFEAEVYNLLEGNVANFSESEKNKITDIIEKGPYLERTWDIGTVDEKAKSFWKQGWYSALNEVEPFKSRYEELRQQTNKQEFFNFKQAETLTPLHYRSILNDMDAISLLEKEPLRYVELIQKFDQKPPNKVDSTLHEMPCTEGNAEQLRRLSNSYPEIITAKIIEFASLKPIYIRHILYGLRETKDRQNIKWKQLCPFMEKYVDKLYKENISSENIKENKNDVDHIPLQKEGESIIGVWADIISVKEDKDYIDSAEIKRLLCKNLKLLLTKYSFDYNAIYSIRDGKKYPMDYLTLTINTNVGKVLEKLIRIVLDEDIHKLDTLKDIYEEMLEKQIVEAYVFLGLYFIYFYKNLEEWTKNKISSILVLSEDAETCKYWEMFFEGFISSNVQYLDYYDWMFDHYKKAIEIYQGRGGDRLIDLLTQFFEAGKDNLKERSLIRCCWEQSAFQLLSGCVREISFPLDKDKPHNYISDKELAEQEQRITAKAKELWDFLWEQIGRDKHNLSLAESPEEQKKLFANVLGLIPALPSLDENTSGRISQLIKCMDLTGWGISSLLSNLIYLTEKSTPREGGILNLAKLYRQIIEKTDYFAISDHHQRVIELLKQHISVADIKHQIDLIKSIYVNKKWNQYLDWFPD